MSTTRSGLLSPWHPSDSVESVRRTRRRSLAHSPSKRAVVVRRRFGSGRFDRPPGHAVLADLLSFLSSSSSASSATGSRRKADGCVVSLDVVDGTTAVDDVAAASRVRTACLPPSLLSPLSHSFSVCLSIPRSDNRSWENVATRATRVPHHRH